MPAPLPDLRALGLEIARLRRDRGMSIERVAEIAEVHRKTIIQIEAGRVAARISTLHGIAHALGVPLTELVAPVCARHPKSVGTPAPLVEQL
ncbi:helix-turn-helix domain-containing protein [Kocuria gwangalliensis]|uniref:helix-turn-helix domain-containing protein n=1 Tax=Kocuria gwangalliensis TaxID=501592 RepID=UPI0031E77316